MAAGAAVYRALSQTPGLSHGAVVRHGALALIGWPAPAASLLDWLQRESLACVLVPHLASGGEPVRSDPIRYWPPRAVERLAAEATGAGTLIAFHLAALQLHGLADELQGRAPELLHPALLRPQVVPLLRPQQRFVGQALTTALELIHQAHGVGSAAPLTTLALDGLLLRSLALLVVSHQDEPTPGAVPITLDEAVDQAMAWMLAHLDRPINLGDLEREIRYGRRSLQQGFRQRVGCGPIQWLRRQRLRLAHERITAMVGPLRPGHSTLTAVARECGYANLSSFSRDFSSHYGYPPSRLLRQG